MPFKYSSNTLGEHKTSPLLRCLQANALLLNNTVFLVRNYQLIVAMRKFDVLKTNIGPPLWHTLLHSLLTLVSCAIVWSKGRLYFSSTCLSSQCFEYLYIIPLWLSLPQFLFGWPISLVLEHFLLSQFPCKFEKRAWLVNYSFMQFSQISTSYF